MARTVPLEVFATLVAQPSESIRTATKRGLAPIQRSPKAAHATARRVYDLEDTVTWIAFEALRDAGMAPRPAAAAARDSGIGPSFANALEHDVATAYAMCLLVRRVRDPLTDSVATLIEIGEAATARRHLASASIDRNFADREQLMALTCVPIWPYWEAAMQRAAGLPVPWAQLGLPEPSEAAGDA